MQVRRWSVLLLGIAMLACRSELEPLPPDEPPEPLPRHVSALIDGRSWTAANVEVEYDASAIRVTATIGRFPTGETLEFQFLRSGVGTQQLEGLTGGRYGRVAIGNLQLWQTGLLGGTGTLTVTTMTPTRVIGTFAFTAGGGLTSSQQPLTHVTDGAFDVTFR